MTKLNEYKTLKIELDVSEVRESNWTLDKVIRFNL